MSTQTIGIAASPTKALCTKLRRDLLLEGVVVISGSPWGLRDNYDRFVRVKAPNVLGAFVGRAVYSSRTTQSLIKINYRF